MSPEAVRGLLVPAGRTPGGVQPPPRLGQRLHRIPLLGLPGLGEIALRRDLVPAGLDPLRVQRGSPGPRRPPSRPRRPPARTRPASGPTPPRRGSPQRDEGRTARRGSRLAGWRPPRRPRPPDGRSARAPPPADHRPRGGARPGSSSTRGCSSSAGSGGASMARSSVVPVAAPGAADRNRCARAVAPTGRCERSAHRPGRPGPPAGWLRPPTARRPSAGHPPPRHGLRPGPSGRR